MNAPVSRMLLQSFHECEEREPSSATAKPAGRAPESTVSAGEVAHSDRADRFLERLDGELSGIHSPDKRHAFLSRMLDHWEGRYARWLSTEGKSEYCADPANPITAFDFLETITGIGARLFAEVG